MSTTEGFAVLQIAHLLHYIKVLTGKKSFKRISNEFGDLCFTCLIHFSIKISNCNVNFKTWQQSWNTFNHTNCKNDSVAKVVTSALSAHAAAVIRLYSGRLNGL